VSPAYEPYLWRVELTSLTTFLPEDGTLTVPYMDHSLMLHLPHLRTERFDLKVRVSYTRETSVNYFGVGNQSRIADNESLGDPRYEYSWIHPTIAINSQQKFADPFLFDLSIRYTHNWLDVGSDTKLAEDAQAGSGSDEFIGPLREHGVATFGYGIAMDTRDGSVSPSRGMYHSLRLDWSPGGTHEIPYHFGRTNATVRFYVPIGHDGSTFAMRGVADLLFGDPPIYELPRYDQSSNAFGGSNGVRGVPGQRYHGKIKFFGTLELRKNLFEFDFLSKKNKFGVAAFVDSGRLFADYARRPDLDGTSLGLKLGTGGGIRVQGGDSFVIRADVAWSPDARPVGAYLASGQIF
jgi:outer membrane protein assembly factor BamA